MEQRKLKFNLQGTQYQVWWYSQNTHHIFLKRNGKDISMDELPTKRKVFIRDAVRRQEAKITRESFRKTQQLFYAYSPQGKAEAAKQSRMAESLERLKRLLKK